MTPTQKKSLNKQKILLLCFYFVPLAFAYEIERLLSRSEGIVQALDTLWPVAAFTALLMAAIINALLLVQRTPLWLLLCLHAACAVLWLARWQIALLLREQDHTCATLVWPPWPLLILLGLSALPPLLGLALLRFRTRRLKAVAATPQPADPARHTDA